MLSFIFLLQTASADVPKTIPLPHIRGKELYDDLCFQCHGVNGLADTPLAASTKSPKLAGQFADGNYADGIKVVQQGIGVMPAYEMVIDKHDTKRILIYLSGLDPETGIDPRVKSETEDDSTKDKNENVKADKDPSKGNTKEGKSKPMPRVSPQKKEKNP